MKSWSEIGFEIEVTDDQSPSLRLLTSIDPTKDRGESMHHSGGACTETLLIYGEPISKIQKKVVKPRFLIVGLGLGYIELVIARQALLQGKTATDVGLITSYESVPELKEYFFKWLYNKKNELHEEVWNTYEAVLKSVIAGTHLKKEDLTIFLQAHFKSLSDIQEALHAEVVLPSRYHCILYDAFSSKTSPFLWEEEFLVNLLNHGTARPCVLSTYACKGSLKRALKKQGFEVVVREGFKGKRNSTLGLADFNEYMQT
ncbi:MAG: MnmC family methyltransferase [Pseudobdellovibrionaceae bacterium]